MNVKAQVVISMIKSVVKVTKNNDQTSKLSLKFEFSPIPNLFWLSRPPIEREESPYPESQFEAIEREWVLLLLGRKEGRRRHLTVCFVSIEIKN